MALPAKRTVRLARCAGLIAAVAVAGCGRPEAPGAQAATPPQIARGGEIYAKHCAACHGGNLEGQPDWRKRGPNGRLPAPPHDDTGHTWHHPAEVLFGITKFGLTPQYAPPGYQSDMPAFGGVLSDDEIRAVLGYIESRWSPEIRQARAERLRQMRGG